MLAQQIKEKANSRMEEIRQHRRHLHQHPELSFQEKETARYVAAQLDKYGIPYRSGVADNGIVALIEGKDPGRKVIALRADMDALPITEENEVPYKSKNPGVMHACGHDVHTASLLGAAGILQDMRRDFSGTIKLIFQPGEEKLPGGASLMIREGVLENPHPNSIFGQHVHPPLEAGKLGFCPGKYMGSADEIYVTVRGRGGHAALPHENVDPVLITAHIITALQQIVSRHANPVIPSVLSFGKIQSTGGATNVIPSEVKMAGTFRTMDENWRKQAHQKMQVMAEQIAMAMGGSCHFDIVVGYPTLYNDEALTTKARALAVDYLGAENVVDLPMRLSAEDFAYYSQEIPACFYRLGTGNEEKGVTSSVHTPTFDIDESALPIGAGFMAWLAVASLEGV